MSKRHPGMVAEEEFEPEPHTLRGVRAFVGRAVLDPGLVDDVVLVASEFATNVIRHAKTAFNVRLTNNDEIVRLEVYDGSSVPPAVNDLDESKRGFRIVEALVDDWGFEVTGKGKAVWAEFSAREAPTAGESDQVASGS